jgi:hypothetical protein
VCAIAAEVGNLDVLKWARENDCPWDDETCANAAEGGHLEVLKWARENDCPWDEDTCANAAQGGHLETLKWGARERLPVERDDVRASGGRAATSRCCSGRARTDARGTMRRARTRRRAAISRC